jgi:hypothetical protein
LLAGATHDTVADAFPAVALGAAGAAGAGTAVMRAEVTNGVEALALELRPAAYSR